MKYDENIPSHFKNNNPTLFLGANVPQEIKDKFYNREFTLKDFNYNVTIPYYNDGSAKVDLSSAYTYVTAYKGSKEINITNKGW